MKIVLVPISAAVELKFAVIVKFGAVDVPPVSEETQFVDVPQFCAVASVTFQNAFCESACPAIGAVPSSNAKN